MSYSPDQRRIARTIDQVGKRRGASRKQRKAALETALVETRLSNPRGGSGTSAGWRQEIDTYGSVGKRTNVRGAARRFFAEAKGADRPGLPSGALAQAVQRSAFPERYGQHAGEAGKLLRSLGGGGGRTVTKTTPGVDRSGERAALVQQLINERSPSFETLLSIRKAKDTPGTKTTTRVPARKGSGGHVAESPTADRPGVHTAPAVRRFVRQISGLAGETLTIGTGTRHSRMTVNGNVSDHWSGHAADIPASGRKLIRLGQAALIAAGMSPAKARKQTGGLYNQGGHQIIFNTQEGGDHTDHLHVSAH
jgi:hypothetical protein